MKQKIKQPLLEKSHLPLYLLGGVMMLFGVVSALVWSISSDQAMRGLLTAGQLRTRLAGFESTGGLLVGVLFFALFIWCILNARGAVRTAFSVGLLASFAPILTARAETLLFDVLGLRLPAGSVVAGALTTLVFALPMTIFFIILASSRCVPRNCRWLSLVSIFVVLVTALFPIIVTLLAFLVKPGDPAVGRMMEFSSQVIKMRYILPGLCILLLAFLSTRFHSSLQVSEPVINATEQGETK